MIAKLESEGQCKILRVSGRVDFESALDFEQQINSMIQQDCDCFIIELSEVELLSSAGLRVLLSTAKRVSHRDASLGLAAPSQVVRQVFEISHFNLLFKIFPSVAEALTALKGLNAAVQTDELAQEARLSETATLEEKTESVAQAIPVVQTPASPEVRGIESSPVVKSPAGAPPERPPEVRASETPTGRPLPPSLPA